MAEPDLGGLYRNHEDVGRSVETLEAVTFANGTIVPKGVRGVVTSVVPATSTLVYLVETEGHGRRGYDKSQLSVDRGWVGRHPYLTIVFSPLFFVLILVLILVEAFVWIRTGKWNPEEEALGDD